MGSTDRFYVDANVIIRLIEGSDELSNALSRLFVSQTESARPRFATSQLTMAKVLVVPYRDGNDRLIDLYDNWMRGSPYIEVGPIDRSVLWYAAVLRSQHRHLKLPDAIHISTAIGMNCSHILSADERLRDKYELVHKRYGILRGPAIVEVLRPDIETIETLTQSMGQ
jgi:predicted nucleic acid-binding protein